MIIIMIYDMANKLCLLQFWVKNTRSQTPRLDSSCERITNLPSEVTKQTRAFTCKCTLFLWKVETCNFEREPLYVSAFTSIQKSKRKTRILFIWVDLTTVWLWWEKAKNVRFLEFMETKWTQWIYIFSDFIWPIVGLASECRRSFAHPRAFKTWSGYRNLTRVT